MVRSWTSRFTLSGWGWRPACFRHLDWDLGFINLSEKASAIVLNAEECFFCRLSCSLHFVSRTVLCLFVVFRFSTTITVIYILAAECKKCLALIFAASIILRLILSDLISSSFSFSSVSALDLMAVR